MESFRALQSSSVGLVSGSTGDHPDQAGCGCSTDWPSLSTLVYTVTIHFPSSTSVYYCHHGLYYAGTVALS